MKRKFVAQLTIFILLFSVFSCSDHNKPVTDVRDMAEKNSGILKNEALSSTGSVISKAKLIRPVYKKLQLEVSASGYIDYDNNTKADISSRYSGRIEKLYVRYNYQKVKKGDPLFEIYSPELITAEENLLYLLKTSPDEKELIDAARQKLVLLQLTPEQISEIESSGKVKNTITVYSRYDGHVHEMQSNGMDEQKMGSYAQTPLISIREGMYVERGMVLFNILNPHMVVAMLKIKAEDIGKVRKSQGLIFYLNNDTSRTMYGTVDFVEPVFSNGAKSMMVRVNVDNMEHEHKVGSLVNAKIFTDSVNALWIPGTAVVDLGKETVAWKWQDGNFKAIRIKTGMRTGNLVEVKEGLSEKDKIAEEAHYFSDSEGFIKSDDNEKK